MLTNLFLYSGVAVGSSIGHAVGGLFGGGSSAPAEPQQAAPPADAQPMDNGLWQSSATNSSWENAPCETDIRNFRKCMDDHQGNMSICGWYMDQLVRLTYTALIDSWEKIFLLTIATESLPGCR